MLHSITPAHSEFIPSRELNHTYVSFYNIKFGIFNIFIELTITVIAYAWMGNLEIEKIAKK